MNKFDSIKRNRCYEKILLSVMSSQRRGESTAFLNVISYTMAKKQNMRLVCVALAVVLALFLLYVFFSMSKESFKGSWWKNKKKKAQKKAKEEEERKREVKEECNNAWNTMKNYGEEDEDNACHEDKVCIKACRAIDKGKDQHEESCKEGVDNWGEVKGRCENEVWSDHA